MGSIGTMSRRLAALGAAAFAGGLVLASVAPAGAQGVPTANAVVSTISGCITINVGSTGTGPGASAQTVNQVWKCSIEADDERLSGELDLVYNIAGWSGVGAIQWGWARITTDEGSWDGVWSSNVDADGEQVILAWYEGSGAYDGWSYTETQYGEFQAEREGFGIVYPGDPPPSVVIVPLQESELVPAQ